MTNLAWLVVSHISWFTGSRIWGEKWYKSIEKWRDYDGMGIVMDQNGEGKARVYVRVINRSIEKRK